MEVKELVYPREDRLKTLICLNKTGGKSHEVGTGFLPAGCRMPDEGRSAHPRHEVSIILEGKIRTESGGKTAILEAGDIVSIPEGQSQCTEVMEDTRLVYIFFDK